MSKVLGDGVDAAVFGFLFFFCWFGAGQWLDEKHTPDVR
jgi:hypothetical protein